MFLEQFDENPGLQGLSRAILTFTILFLLRLAPKTRIRSRQSSESDLHFLRRLRKQIDENDDYTSKRLDRMIRDLSAQQPTPLNKHDTEEKEILPLKRAGSMQELKFDVSQQDMKYITKKIGALNYLFTSKRVGRVLDSVDKITFNVFDLKSAADGNELYVIVNWLYRRHHLFTKLKIDGRPPSQQSAQRRSSRTTRTSCSRSTTTCTTTTRRTPPTSRRCVPPPQVTRALQSSYYFGTRCQFREIAKLNDIDFAALILGPFMHDTAHLYVSLA